MEKLRIRFQKTEDLRFLSHLDLVRAFERGLRRAELPLSFSEGFSPHPKIAFGPPLPVGVSSESEYVDVMIDYRVPLKDIASALDRAFPQDLRCREVRYVRADATSLMSLITLASYRIVVSVHPLLTRDEVQNCLNSLMAEKEIALLIKDKEKVFLVDQIVKALDLEGLGKDLLTLNFLGLVGSAGGVRPDVLIAKMLATDDEPRHLEFQAIHRTGLYWEKDGKPVKP